MKQKILFGIFIGIIFFLLLIPNQSLAVTSTNQYTIQSYNINMIVNEDNTFDITENITVYFNVARHGIYRKIPLRNTVTRTDGTKSNNRAKITDIRVSENSTISNENGYKVIKIGDINQMLTGKHSYTIKYKYNIGKDPLKNADELYFNLIGDQWDTNINKVFFTITMPKPFNKLLLGFSSGNVGSTDNSSVTYTVNGNTIIGNTINTLNAGQALTVRLTLPEGYFVEKVSNMDIFSIFIIIICAVFVLMADRLWRKYGKDDQVVETVEFYPPEGYNSAEVNFLYNGSVNTKGIISLLIYLANQGYLKIEETEKKGLVSTSKDFKITKMKEYTGNNEYERLFFNGLFKGSKTKTTDMDKTKEIRQEENSLQDTQDVSVDNGDNKDYVTTLDLYDNFYTTLNKIEEKMNSKENRSKIFKSSASGKIKYLIIMIISIFLLLTVKPVMEYGNLIFVLLFQRNRIFCINRNSYRCYKNTDILCNNMGSDVWRIAMGINDTTNINTRYYVFNNLSYWHKHYCRANCICKDNA